MSMSSTDRLEDSHFDLVYCCCITRHILVNTPTPALLFYTLRMTTKQSSSVAVLVSGFLLWPFQTFDVTVLRVHRLGRLNFINPSLTHLWFCLHRLRRYINHLLTYVLTYLLTLTALAWTQQKIDPDVPESKLSSSSSIFPLIQFTLSFSALLLSM